MIDLYTHPASSNGQRVAIMLEEAAIPYRAHLVDLERGEHQGPAYLRINPAGQVPAIVDPDRPGGKPLTLCQSGAILLYLSEKSGKLMPREPMRRGLALQWFLQAMSDTAPASAILYMVGTIPEITTGTRKLFEQRLLMHLRNCDKRLGEAEFLAGELSIADVALYPTVAFRRELIEQAGDLPNLARWVTMMAARPALQRGLRAAT
jgi:GSH-dependent disulfide-bond oxidoreductase